MGLFKNLFGKPKNEKMNDALYVTKKSFIEKLSNLFSGNVSIYEDYVEELEEILISSDVGIDTTFFILDKLEKVVKKKSLNNKEDIFIELKNILIDTIQIEDRGDNETLFEKGGHNIVLVVGVNGVGKTTTIAKIANLYKNNDYKVVLGAADTFRAAAINQLAFWAEKINVPIIKREQGDDPGAVAHDTVSHSVANNIDLSIIDTAGRLHNKMPLMDELSKVYRVVKKRNNDKEPQVWLVLDGTTGQNGIEQAKQFKKITNVSGIIITKLDGTSKGGILFSIAHELNIPVLFIGVGEKIEDITPFSSKIFVDNLFSEGLTMDTH